MQRPCNDNILISSMTNNDAHEAVTKRENRRQLAKKKDNRGADHVGCLDHGTPLEES